MMMTPKVNTIRPFIGAADFEQSRRFYSQLGFTESILSPDMSYFNLQGLGFYLQKAYVKDWVDNTMVFMEVADVEEFWQYLQSLHLPESFAGVRLSTIKHLDWGSECFLHDPSGILWHFGQFRV